MTLQAQSPLGMLVAVLDSNFWLSTHVVSITIGYSATFLAGILAIIFILRGLCTKGLDDDTEWLQLFRHLEAGGS